MAEFVVLREIGYSLVSQWHRELASAPPPTAEDVFRFVDDLDEKLRRGWTPSPPVQGPPSARQAIDYAKGDLVSRTMFLMSHLKRMSDQYRSILLRDCTDRIERRVGTAMLSKLFTFLWGLNHDTRFDVELAPLNRLLNALHDVESGENNRLLMAGERAAKLDRRSYSGRQRTILRARAAAQVELLVVRKVEKGPVPAARRVAEAMTRGGYSWNATQPEETVRKWHRKFLVIERKLAKATEQNPVFLSASEDQYLNLALIKVLSFDPVRRVEYGIHTEPFFLYDADWELHELEGLCRSARLPDPDLGN